VAIKNCRIIKKFNNLGVAKEEEKVGTKCIKFSNLRQLLVRLLLLLLLLMLLFAVAVDVVIVDFVDIIVDICCRNSHEQLFLNKRLFKTFSIFFILFM